MIPLEPSIIDLALGSSFSGLEDAIQYQLALQYQADFFITRNKKDFRNKRIPILDAQEFLHRIIF